VCDGNGKAAHSPRRTPCLRFLFKRPSISRVPPLKRRVELSNSGAGTAALTSAGQHCSRRGLLRSAPPNPSAFPGGELSVGRRSGRGHSRSRSPSTQQSFGRALRRFFADQLPRVRGASPHTVQSYRDAFVLLLRFVAAQRRKPVSDLDLSDLGPQDVLDFRYCAAEHPDQLELCQRVLAVLPVKRARYLLSTSNSMRFRRC